MQGTTNLQRMSACVYTISWKHAINTVRRGCLARQNNLLYTTLLLIQLVINAAQRRVTVISPQSITGSCEWTIKRRVSLAKYPTGYNHKNRSLFADAQVCSRQFFCGWAGTSDNGRESRSYCHCQCPFQCHCHSHAPLPLAVTHPPPPLLTHPQSTCLELGPDVCKGITCNLWDCTGM